MKIEFLDIAEAELDDAFKYYEQIYKGLGTKRSPRGMMREACF